MKIVFVSKFSNMTKPIKRLFFDIIIAFEFNLIGIFV